jgi:hypothetical protein
MVNPNRIHWSRHEHDRSEPRRNTDPRGQGESRGTRSEMVRPLSWLRHVLRHRVLVDGMSELRKFARDPSGGSKAGSQTPSAR